MVFPAVVLSILLYTYDTWNLYCRYIKRLERFQQTKLWRISLLNIAATILQHRLRWAGPVFRMRHSRLQRISLFGATTSFKRLRRCSKRFYTYQLRTYSTQVNINLWQGIALLQIGLPDLRPFGGECKTFESNRQQDEDLRCVVRRGLDAIITQTPLWFLLTILQD